MGLEELISRLERDADARVAAIASRATAEVDALTSEEGRRSRQLHEDELVSRRATRRASLEGALADARRKARGAALEARHALLARIFARAERIARDAAEVTLDDATLGRWLEEALCSLDELDVVVRCGVGLKARIEQNRRRARGGDRGGSSVPPGLLAEARDGSVSADNTLPRRIERLRPRLAISLLAEHVGSRGAP